MTKLIFSHRKSTFEEFLRMESDRSFTYWSANDGWAAFRQGSLDREVKLDADAAKQRWPQHAEAIEAALRGE